MFPKRAVSSIVGIGGMAGSVGGIAFPFFIGWILETYKEAGNLTGGYNIIFTVCASAYLVAWLIMHLLTPRMKIVKL
jgi:ACS family hexuronate transporter-like MFS transporter